MLIAVVGGKLQGVEAVYLAQKAGWATLVIDKNPDAPAIGLCDRFLKFNFTLDHPVPPDCPRVDLILPAVEDTAVLTAVKAWAEIKNIPLAFDPTAYSLSCSKLKSDALFKRMNLPAPRPWPGCSFPVVVKPDLASGSRGVEIVSDFESFSSKFPNLQHMDHLVVQEYVDGPSYSIEIIGSPGKYQTLQVTDLGMDDIHDCKRVAAPTQLSSHDICRFEEMAVAIAEEIHLTGIMDVEVVLNKNQLKLLEIDARFPSQTPMCVYWSTGINMVEMIGSLFLNRKVKESAKRYERYVVVEHIQVSGSGMEILGEHIMAQDGPLTRHPDFFGADEAITSFVPGKSHWVATMVFVGNTQAEVNAKREKSYSQIIEATCAGLKEPLH
ncbi:MAG: 3-methylornithine--L-lysine ligase PylC [Desulfobacterium sp.]|nr:3-methylornithine--L-lysine ligase PylC [Desulfobacterium sp.]